MYRAYVSKIVVFDSASRLGTSIEIEQAHAFDGIRGFGTAGGVPLRNVETDILKGFFTKLKKAFLLPGSVCDAVQSLRLRELCRASLQPTQ
jgi:hypothetical protein